MSAFVIALIVVVVSTLGVVVLAQADPAQRATEPADPDGGPTAATPAETPVLAAPEPLPAAPPPPAREGPPPTVLAGPVVVPPVAVLPTRPPVLLAIDEDVEAIEAVPEPLVEEDGEEEEDWEPLADEVVPSRVRSGVALVLLLAGLGAVLAVVVGALAALVGLALREAAGIG